MAVKIKCEYVAKGEAFTLGKEYDVYFLDDDSAFYIIDDNDIRFKYSSQDGYLPTFDGLLTKLNDDCYSYFIASHTPDKEEPEKDIKEEVHNLLDKATELIYNNQEELDISFDDFITLVRIKEVLKWKNFTHLK